MADALGETENNARAILEKHKYLILAGAVVGGYLYYKFRASGSGSGITSQDLTSAYSQGMQAASLQPASTTASETSDPTAQYYSDLLNYQTGEQQLYENYENWLYGLSPTTSSNSAANSGTTTTTTPAAAAGTPGTPMLTTSGSPTGAPTYAPTSANTRSVPLSTAPKTPVVTPVASKTPSASQLIAARNVRLG